MGAGDFKQDEFSQEELAALGEAETTAPAAEKAEPATEKEPEPESEATGAPETKDNTETKTEQPNAEEKKEIEKTGARFENGYVIDEDGEKIPLKRFREVYREAKDGERAKERLAELKRLGPEQFYQTYPDVAPAGYAPPITQFDIRAVGLIAQYDDPNHEFHGMTLGQIYALGTPEAKQEAARLYRSWEAPQREAVEARKRAEAKTAEQNAQEASEFAAIVASEKFGKQDVNTLTADEVRQICEFIKETYLWGVKNGKQNYSVADMWSLRNRTEAAVSREKQEKALKSLEQKHVVGSIGSGGGSADPGGFEAYAAMSEDQLTAAIDRMKDRDAMKFFKDAPPSLRKKHPGLPWG